MIVKNVENFTSLICCVLTLKSRQRVRDHVRLVELVTNKKTEVRQILRCPYKLKVQLVDTERE